MKSTNTIQKYPHIIELYAYVLQISVTVFLLPMSLLISFSVGSKTLFQSISPLCEVAKFVSFIVHLGIV